MYGCSHMQCTCGAHWCWWCLRSIDECQGDCAGPGESDRETVFWCADLIIADDEIDDEDDEDSEEGTFLKTTRLRAVAQTMVDRARYALHDALHLHHCHVVQGVSLTSPCL